MLLSIRRNPLEFFSRILRKHGGRVRFRVLGRNILLLARPDDLEEVLIKHQEVYGRSVEIRSLRALFGQGLLSSEGAFWKRQRAMIQPNFDRQALTKYGCIMLDCISRQLAEWRPNAIRDIHADMMRYTRETICAVLFGGASVIDHPEMASNVSTVFGDLRSELLYLRLWRCLPFGRSLRWNRAVAALDGSIRQIIEARRSSSELADDLLAALMNARDAEGTSMSNEQLRDEILTFFLAGHETGALALTWAVYLLATHPEVQELARAQVASVTQNGSVTVGHYGQLPYLTAVVKEAMRLYPPVWSLGRQALGDAKLGEIPVPEGTEVWMCIHALQRDRDWYEGPNEFQPERWFDTKRQQPFTYMPFGVGPRVCIGQHFAMMEAVLGLAAILKRFRFADLSGKPAEVSPWITLRPKRPILVRVLSARTHL